MKIEVSAFIAPKAGENIWKCQDSFSLDASMGLFAIADGVSQSLLSDHWSKILTDAYVRDNNNFYADSETKVPQQKLADKFIEELKEYESQLSPVDSEIFNISKQKADFSASTFVGLKIEGPNARIECIGDSVLFFFCGEPLKRVACSSMGNNGIISFGTEPEYYATNGCHNGQTKTVSLALHDGHIFMMTDALSQWINEIRDPLQLQETIDSISNLANHQEYAEFIEQQRRNDQHRLNDDDTTVICLHITESTVPELEYIVRHIDDIGQIQQVELLEKISRQEKEINSLRNVSTTQNAQIIALQSEVKSNNKKIEQLEIELNGLKQKFIRLKGRIKHILDEETL